MSQTQAITSKASHAWIVIAFIVGSVLCLAWLASESNAHSLPPLYTDEKQIVLFLTMPDSSHIRDFQVLAKAYSVVSNIGKENIHFVSFVKEFEIEPDGKFNVVQCKIDERFNLPEMMQNMSSYAKSEIPKMERFKTSFSIMSLAFEMGIIGMKDLFSEHSQNCERSFANTLKESREGKVRLLLVIDSLFNAVIEWADFEGVEYVLIDTPPVMFGYSGAPSYLPQLPYVETSLARGRAILQRDGVISYLKHQVKEQVFEFVEFIKMAYPIVQESNKLREKYGLPPLSGPFFEPTTRVTIHFSIPGVFEYSFPVPQAHKFVGFNYIEKSPSTRQIIGNNQILAIEDVQDEMIWLDIVNQNKQKVVYIAFGTKVNIALEHSRMMVQSILKADPSLNILMVSNWIENKEHLLDHSSMSTEWSKKILIKKWVKQVEVLRHPSVSVFLSHGGAHSVFESIDAKVPLLLFPIFGDQFLNSIRADDSGIGKTIHNLENQEEVISDIQFLIQNSKEISQRMERMKLINKEMSALSVNRDILQRILETNSTSTLSSASLAAATIIRQIALFGSEQFVSTDHQLFAIEKLNIMMSFLTISSLFVICPILAISYQCFCKRKKI